jgi:hypothetical protein
MGEPTPYALSQTRQTRLGTFVTGISKIGDGVSALILPRPLPS